VPSWSKLKQDGNGWVGSGPLMVVAEIRQNTRWASMDRLEYSDFFDFCCVRYCSSSSRGWLLVELFVGV
jgi:hypothetical protein